MSAGSTSQFHFQIANIGGYTSSSMMKLVTMPPTIGAAIRLITSAPEPFDHKIGSNPNSMQATVITLGRSRLTAPAPDHTDWLLVGPGGQTFVFFGDAGGPGAVSNVNLTFDDAAGAQVPDNGPLAAGTFRPSSYVDDSDIFPAPAPAGPYGHAAPQGATTFGLFNGIVPNGTWSLYAVEDTGEVVEKDGVKYAVCIEK